MPPSEDLRRGDFEAFYCETVQRTSHLVRRAVAGDYHASGDLVQESYVEMWRRWPERRTYNHTDNRRYVAGIAMHKVADWYRERGRFTELLPQHERGAEDPAIDSVLDRASLMRCVRDLIDRQPPRRRLVAVLFFIEGFPADEIAPILDLKPSTVRTHVQRLRELLKPYVTRLDESQKGGEQS